MIDFETLAAAMSYVKKSLFGAGAIKGDKGERGLQGVPGVQGEQGIQGIQGEQGIQGIKGDKGDDGYPFLIYKQYDSIDDYKESDFPEIGLMFMVMQFEHEKGYPIYRYTGNNAYSLVTHMNTEGIKGERGEKGEQGEQGVPGIQGEQGEQGVQGLQGEQGEKGADGKSAYEIAKEHGFAGTEQEWATLFNMLKNNGDGDKFLADDGIYKEIRIDAIIDVKSLPTDNIDDSKIYRLTLEPGYYWSDNGDKIPGELTTTGINLYRPGKYEYFLQVVGNNFPDNYRFDSVGLLKNGAEYIVNYGGVYDNQGNTFVQRASLNGRFYPTTMDYFREGRYALLGVGNILVKFDEAVIYVEQNTTKLYHHFNGEWREIGAGVGMPELAENGGLEISEDKLKMTSPIEVREVEGSITDYIPKATTEQYGLVKMSSKRYSNGVNVDKLGNMCAIQMEAVNSKKLLNFVLDTEFRPKRKTTDLCLFWNGDADFMYVICHIGRGGVFEFYAMTGINARRLIDLNDVNNQKYDVYFSSAYSTN